MANDSRAAILRRIRGALAQPLGEGAPATLPDSPAPTFAPLADGESLADRFTRALTAVSGAVQRLDRRADLLAHLRAFMTERQYRRVAVVRSGVLATVDVVPMLRELGAEVRADEDWSHPEHAATMRVWLADADLCISGVDYALAETGSFVMPARPGQPRMATLLPPVHLAVVGEDQIAPALETLVPRLKAGWSSADGSGMGSALTLITGPSRSADIEQTLTLGVHGPVEVIAVLLPDLSRE